MKRLLLVSLLAVFAIPAFAIPAQAHAAAPCRDRIFNDWYADGKIASTYPHACYVDALRHIPADADQYSSLRQDITAAMRAAVLHTEGKAVPTQIGHGFSQHNVLVSGTQSSTQTAPHDASPPSSSSTTQDPAPAGQTANAAVATSSGGGAPLPVLALGGLALALVAAGAIGAGVKHARSRRG
jgi:hypothetical protein